MNKKLMRVGEMIELSLSSRDFVRHERIDARRSKIREKKKERYADCSIRFSKLVFLFGKITTDEL